MSILQWISLTLFCAGLFLMDVEASAREIKAQISRVKIPIETLYRRPNPPAPILGTLWRTKDAKRILLVLKSSSTTVDSQLISDVQKNGFHVLQVELRKKTKWSSKTFLEDVQSAVVFAKSKADLNVERISLFGSGDGAEAALQYANATPQMSRIIDALVVVIPPVFPPKEVKKPDGIPFFQVPQKADRKAIMKFLVAPESSSASVPNG